MHFFGCGFTVDVEVNEIYLPHDTHTHTHIHTYIYARPLALVEPCKRDVPTLRGDPHLDRPYPGGTKDDERLGVWDARV